ncbi:MAG: PorV/PorQ family protein [Ignavibacteria bacterium]|nr:PorV/PorQ family protein [Ignavibacteria bacterium]
MNREHSNKCTTARPLHVTLSVILFLLTLSTVTLAQQKLAQTGLKFLNVGTTASVTAMGEAYTGVESASTAMFYNPAGMARMRGFIDIGLGQTKWIADISHQYLSLAVSPFGGDYGVIGLTALSVDYGEIEETIRWNNEEGYIDLGTFSPSAMMVGVGYAQALTDRFSVGANVKYVAQNLGSSTIGFDQKNDLIKKENSVGVLAFDFGMLYRTGFKSLNFGVSVRNFSKEVRYEREGFQLPLIFRLGLSMNMIDLLGEEQEHHAFLLAVDATHPRDYPEQVNVGAEYVFMQIVAVRAGYMFNNDEYALTAGLGVQQQLSDMRIGVDYSYTPFGVFQRVHRITVRFSY